MNKDSSSHTLLVKDAVFAYSDLNSQHLVCLWIVVELKTP